MRRYIVDKFSLLKGCLLIGLSLVVAYGLYRLIQQGLAPLKVEKPQGFLFLAHERVRDQPRFTVKGTVENTGNQSWEHVRVVADIYVGDAYMTYCWGYVSKLLAHENRSFLIVCKNTEGSKIPSNVHYEMWVSEAVIGRGD